MFITTDIMRTGQHDMVMSRGTRQKDMVMRTRNENA